MLLLLQHLVLGVQEAPPWVLLQACPDLVCEVGRFACSVSVDDFGLSQHIGINYVLPKFLILPEVVYLLFLALLIGLLLLVRLVERVISLLAELVKVLGLGFSDDELCGIVADVLGALVLTHLARWLRLGTLQVFF